MSFFRVALFEINSQPITGAETKAIVSKVLVRWVLAIAIDNRTGRETHHPTMPVRAILGDSESGKYPLYTWYTTKDPFALGYHTFCCSYIELFGVEKYYMLYRKPRATAREHFISTFGTAPDVDAMCCFVLHCLSYAVYVACIAAIDF